MRRRQQHVARAAAMFTAVLPGCTAAHVPATSDDGVTLRVVSYNIRHGRGTDERVDPDRTAAVLRALRPDIVALQEVDSVVTRSGGTDQAAHIAALLGMQHAFGGFFDYQGGRYGMAVLSRRPIARASSVRLPDGNEPRVALAVEIAQPDGTTLTVVNVHFDWVRADSFRFVQAEQVARHLDGLRGPYLLLGDFNDQTGSRTLELFRTRATEAAKPADRRFTFPSTDPAREIDFIFAAPAASWAADSVTVVAEPVASDHRPVFALLRYRAR
jgi:endonuclease/exonuclease/phosphatase family metal-dependent hydrolase